jgi:hypothetical protein
VGARDRPGYGFAFAAFEPPEVEQLVARRHDGDDQRRTPRRVATTVNRWNDPHGASGGTIDLMMPINLRSGIWRQEIVGNF